MKLFLKRFIPRAWWPGPYLLDMIMERSGARVVSGPFQGLKYVRESFASVLYPKLLGRYERELHPVVNEIIASAFDQAVVVGAAEGYYAVGLALRCPHLKVVAFELEEQGRKLLQEMVRINDVSVRIDIRGGCDPAELRRTLEAGQGRQILISDCEGYEDQLLDLNKVPALRDTAILVELHEFTSPGIGLRLRDRFATSHTIEEILTEERTAEEFPLSTLYTRVMSGKYLVWALSECRPDAMSWFWMKPKK